MNKIKVFVVQSEAHDGFIIAHNDKEICDAIYMMHGGDTPEEQSEDFSIEISVREFDKEEYDDLMSREWEA